MYLLVQHFIHLIHAFVFISLFTYYIFIYSIYSFISFQIITSYSYPFDYELVKLLVYSSRCWLICYCIFIIIFFNKAGLLGFFANKESLEDSPFTFQLLNPHLQSTRWVINVWIGGSLLLILNPWPFVQMSGDSSSSSESAKLSNYKSYQAGTI